MSLMGIAKDKRNLIISIIVFSSIFILAVCNMYLLHQSCLIDINRADKYELMQIQGIGDVLSDRIIDYREYNGCFYSIEELTRVNGLNHKSVNKIKKYIKIVPIEIDEIMDEVFVEEERFVMIQIIANKFLANILLAVFALFLINTSLIIYLVNLVQKIKPKEGS